MKIIIDYDSCWRNSFLDGSNNEPFPSKKGRNFVGSMKNLKKDKNFIKRDVTLDTVMGLLNRLIGDQRKLYQSRESANYYFQQIENRVSFVDIPTSMPSSEVVYIRNLTGSLDKNSFSGVLKVTDPAFDSPYSSELWTPLWMQWESLCNFIIDPLSNIHCNLPQLDPLAVCDQFEVINKYKAIPEEGLEKQALSILKKYFPDVDYLNNKGLIVPNTFYCSALYLQLNRLDEKFDLTDVKTKSGGISGVSKRNFTKKDFMKRFTTGKGKLIFGNPYLLKQKIKGEGEVSSVLTKASGILEINIDIEINKANELKTLIENAGVSSFYLGKKGLAYVSSIDPRPTRKNDESLF